MQRTLILLLFPLVLCAHLPVIRPSDSKRALASRLIRSADRHKERSLQDVLGERRQPQRQKKDKTRRAQRAQNEQPEQKELHTMSELFAWAINNTVHNLNLSQISSIEYTSTTTNKLSTSSIQPHNPPALPSKSTTHKTIHQKPTISIDDLNLETLSSTTTESEILHHHLETLKKAPISHLSNSLRILEELCHSIDNALDLNQSGGLSLLIKSLSHSHSTIRANAAWALATCTQNNPTVQTSALSSLALLSTLAAEDPSSLVRSKALFALNAMLELPAARIQFEQHPKAIHALRNALLDSSDYRATRRALNLTELLVQRNLDAWRGTLEAWDIPMLVERLMRSHPDIDVRTSAARTIAALDGRPVA